MMNCENGFGGGNVAVSVGSDGVLVVDDMYKMITPLLISEIRKITASPIRLVVNSHFHRDHIEGNNVLSNGAIVVAHENLFKRFKAGSSWANDSTLPKILIRDSLTINFNGEEIKLFHLPNGHSDNDVVVYFPKSGVAHLGDLYFNGMFPAVYRESGGDLKQMIVNLQKILTILPSTTKVIPGHGDLGDKNSLTSYVEMLQQTTSIVEHAIKSGKTLEQLQKEKVLAKYDELGSGGAQTTDQYLAMLYKLLSN